MTEIVFAALVAAGLWVWTAPDADQDGVSDATGYRMYWSVNNPWTWDRAYSVDIPGGEAESYDDAPIAHLITPSPGSVFYFSLVPYNEYGEAIHEHGNVLDSDLGVCP